MKFAGLFTEWCKVVTLGKSCAAKRHLEEVGGKNVFVKIDILMLSAVKNGCLGSL